MKAYLILALFFITVTLTAVFGVVGCHRYKQEVRILLKKNAQQKTTIDSLTNRAAIDCDQRIQNALNKNAYEIPIDRPVKPDFLR